MVFSVSLYAQQKPGLHGQTMVKQGAGKTRTITIVNNCKQNIWWASFGDAKAGGGFFASPGGGGDILAPGGRTTITVTLEKETPSSPETIWHGRFWPRTGCNFNKDGIGMCETGRCQDRLKCVGAGFTGVPPASLIEATFNEAVYDTYDLSYVDGTNVPVQIKPTAAKYPPPRSDKLGCGAPKCTFNFAKEANSTDESSCLNKLKFRNNKGAVVGCYSACDVDAIENNNMTNNPNCCTGNYFGPVGRKDYGNCPPTASAQFFLQKCSDPYPWPQGDLAATYVCVSSSYEITFCPQ
jgi:hypothetical protein